MEIEAVLESMVRPTGRVAQVAGLFDLPAETGAVDAVARARWDAAAARWLLDGDLIIRWRAHLSAAIRLIRQLFD